MAKLESIQVASIANATINALVEILIEEECAIDQQTLSTKEDKIQYTLARTLKCNATY